MRLDDRSVEWGDFSPICSFCQHKQKKYTCKAFANGIPESIWMGQNNHRKPYPGDNGIQFEPIKVVPE